MAKQKLQVHLSTWNMVLFTHISFNIVQMATNRRLYFDTMSGCHGEPGSKCVFEIEGDINEILDWWDRRGLHSIIHNNCGDITQEFLERFANIPAPHALAAPFSINYFSLGICLPSFLPIGITLPGRIMDNAKFYIEARNNPEMIQQYSAWALKLTMAVSIVLMVLSIIGIEAAAALLSGSIVMPAVVTCLVVGTVSSIGFFKSANKLAMIRESKEEEEKPQALDRQLLTP